LRNQKKMNKDSISSHLLELRSRIIKVLICLGIFFIAGIPFASEIYSIAASPLLSILPEGSSMIATQVTSPFMAPIKLVLFAAMFMSPGLYKDEKKFVAPLMISTILLFAAGIAFAYFVVCPIIFKFFIASAPNSIQVMTDISQYLNFIIRLVFAFGIAFEIPVATFLLIKSGIVKKDSLHSFS